MLPKTLETFERLAGQKGKKNQRLHSSANDGYFLFRVWWREEREVAIGGNDDRRVGRAGGSDRRKDG